MIVEKISSALLIRVVDINFNRVIVGGADDYVL
jgi:hypothetical protein